MSKIIYHIENAPGKIYGKNSNELIFKEPTSNVHIYSTATDTGLLRATKKHLFRGPPSEKEGGVCVATIDEPSASNHGGGTLEMHHHPATAATGGGDASTKLKLTKTTSWVPNLLPGAAPNHSVTFRGTTYTWSGKATLKRDRDGRAVARVTGGWFFQGKLADIELDVPEDDGGGEEGRRETLEMVLASFVLRWWADKVEEAARAAEKKEAAKEQKEVKKAVAMEKKVAKEEEKKKQQKEEVVVEGVDDGQAAPGPGEGRVMGP